MSFGQTSGTPKGGWAARYGKDMGGFVDRMYGKENHSPRPHPIKKVEIEDAPQGYFLTVSRGGKVIERRGPSASLSYIMSHALEHCGFDDEPKTPTIIDRKKLT